MDLDTLLLPLSVEEPCGISLLYEAEHDDIGSARWEDDAAAPRREWAINLKKANWKEVIHLSETALTRRSKDLQVAAWLGEAWIATDGMAGAVRALSLINGLCEQFWDQIHPLPREGDYEYRTGPLNWADKYWSDALLMRLPLVVGTGPEARSFTLLEWNEALAVEASVVKDKDARKKAEAAGLATWERINDNLAGMPLAALARTVTLVRSARAALESFNAFLEPRVPKPGARMSKLERRLAELDVVLTRCQTLHPAYVAPAPAAVELTVAPTEEQPMPDPITVTTAPAAPPAAAPSGRAEAYQRLRDIADYLATIEPHSPVPALIRRAVELGGLSFDQLMAELMRNNGELQKLLCRDVA